MTGEDEVFGWWLVTDDDGEVIHKVAGHHRPDSAHHQRAEAGLLRRIDLDRFAVVWVGVDEVEV